MTTSILLTLAGCGGSGGENPTTEYIPVAESQYTIKTNAARTAFQAKLDAALAEADSWMQENGMNSDVVTTSSGLQYRINKASPTPDGKRYDEGQAVIVHYEGRLTDGTLFDSSYERGRPAELKPDELIEGWQEALRLMQPGDEWTLFIPPALGYAARGLGGGVPPNSVLIFDVALR